VGLKVLKAASMKMTIFWDVVLCSMADVSEVLTASITHRPDEGGSNAGKRLPEYTAQQPRRQPSSLIKLLLIFYFHSQTFLLFIYCDSPLPRDVRISWLQKVKL
jgi:hypothetical protein